ncbi:MAG: hypothetical protein K0A92_05160 [Methyloprofundus sp.]|nr:hypothetical protein [Methyloprofundus sp.]
MNLKNLLPFGKANPLLVCETDGFSLRGAVLSRVGHQLSVLYQAHIDQSDMVTAVPELLAALKNQGWQGKSKAVLLSPAVLSTLVELPVNPKKPRPLQQMLALIKNESELLLMQHMMRWSVGYLLVGRGHMTEEQAQTILDLQQGKSHANNDMPLQEKFSFRRFGDLAEELGYIKRSQLNACLSVQEWLKSDDEQIECNWAGQGPVQDAPGLFNWLVSCVSQSLLQRWVGVFATEGLELTALYPFTACSSVFLPDDKETKITLDSHPGETVAIREEGGYVTHQHTYLNTDKSALAGCLESYHALPSSQFVPVYLSCDQAEMTELVKGLQQSIEVVLHPLEHAAMSAQLTIGMLGAASHYFALGKKNVCVAVLESGPIAPLLQRLEVRAGLLAGLLLLLLMVSELTLFVRQYTLETEYQPLQSRWSLLDAAKRRVDDEIKNIKKTQTELNQQQTEQQRLKSRLDFYYQAIPARVSLIKDLLGALQIAVTNEVIVTSLTESDRTQDQLPLLPEIKPNETEKMLDTEHFTLQAWALSESAAQFFIQTMQKTLAPSNLEVRDVPVVNSTGPMGLNGFSIKMQLVRRVPLASLRLQQID